MTAEFGKPVGMFNWRTQSWAFLFGDSLSLPLAIAFALGTPGIPSRVIGVSGMIEYWRWCVISIVVAIVVTFGFRSMDAAGYKKSGNADRLKSPTKLWHDYVVYPSIAFLLMWVALPAVFTGATTGWLTLTSFGTWVLFCICDMVRGLDPANLHPRMQETILADLQ